MIRLNSRIRLTNRELHFYRLTTERRDAPKTVDAYNRALDETARYWREIEDSPESRLLQAIILAERID